MKITKRRLIIVGLLGLLATGIIFGDRQYMEYRYELYIEPIIKYLISPETNPVHKDEDQTDESPLPDTAIDTD